MKLPLIIVFFRETQSSFAGASLCGVADICSCKIGIPYILYITDFCSCKIGIQYILYISSVFVREPGQLLCKFLAENAGAPA